MVNRDKSRVRSRVEHVFAVIKKLWGFTKVRYRGLAKNGTRAFVVSHRAGQVVLGAKAPDGMSASAGRAKRLNEGRRQRHRQKKRPATATAAACRNLPACKLISSA
jgi:hypothetical protein